MTRHPMRHESGAWERGVRCQNVAKASAVHDRVDKLFEFDGLSAGRDETGVPVSRRALSAGASWLVGQARAERAPWTQGRGRVPYK